MGSFYVNICVRDISQAQIVEILERTKGQAIVGPEQNGWCGFVTSDLDSQDEKLIRAFLEGFSRKFDTHAVSVLNHDEDILVIKVWKSGVLIADYNSCPGYFRSNPTEADLQAVFSNIDVFVGLARDVPESEFRSRMLDGESGYVDTFEAHEFLISAIGLPKYTLGFSYKYASVEDDWGDPTAFLRVNSSSSAQ